MDWYDVMQVCMNGHVITDRLKMSPEFGQEYCDKCGEKTISSCPNCGEDIQGEYHVEGVVAIDTTAKVPRRNCKYCGKPFPWTSEEETPDTKEVEEVWSLIHPSIVEVSRTRFEHGHRADAVEAALKAVNTRIKRHIWRERRRELDGASLMYHAFSPDNPVIELADDLTTQSGKDMQRGYMEIFAGAMLGIRNPKAHENIDVDETRAFHHLFLASLLMEKLDEAGVP